MLATLGGFEVFGRALLLVKLIIPVVFFFARFTIRLGFILVRDKFPFRISHSLILAE